MQIALLDTPPSPLISVFVCIWMKKRRGLWISSNSWMSLHLNCIGVICFHHNLSSYRMGAMTVTSSFQINAKPGMLYSTFPLWSTSYIIHNLHVIYRFQGAGCIGSTLEQDFPTNTPELVEREKGHLIVFDDNLFGFLWISSKKFSLFHRVQDPSLQVLKKNWISLRDFVQVI